MARLQQPKKSLGQHWLTDEATLSEIADTADISDSDTILEVGPGHGSLTKILVGRASAVVAVEFDEHLARNLDSQVNAENLTAHNADILDFDLAQLPAGYKVVANIPYYLTSHLIRRLLEADNQPSLVVLLIQKEVAERIVAEPGRMSILSVAAQIYADCSLGVQVPAEMFDPAPKVDSQVVILKPKAFPDGVDRKSLFRVVKAGFGEKRKKLANSLSGGLSIEKEEVTQLLAELGFGANVRAQELSVADWLRLQERINSAS